MDKMASGKDGENFAAVYLESQGHEILERNFRNRTGEIDIISLKENTLFFVEVKTWQFPFVHPLETFDRKKQGKMRSLAKYFFYQKAWQESDFFVSFCLAYKGPDGFEFYTDLF
jgi:putative endonuclease